MRFFRIAAAAAASLALALAILGSWVRINGAGMSCPDWPLCHGRLLPPLVGGILLEWTHRLIALTVGFVIVAAFVAGWRVRRAIAGVGPTLLVLVAIFVLQVIVGGITIRESNSPSSVTLHWGVAMLLLATLTTLAVLAFLAPRAGCGLPALRRGAPVPALAVAALLAYATMCIGSYVSSSGAGLACATFPACDGSVLGSSPPQLAQMVHRIAAGLFVISALAGAALAIQSGMTRVRAWAVAGAALALLQVALGTANVLWRMPAPLREAHAANAALMFVVFIVATSLATLDPLPVASATEKGFSMRRAV